MVENNISVMCTLLPTGFLETCDWCRLQMTFVERIFLKLNIINQMICHLRNPVQVINYIIYFTTRAISREGILSFFDNENKYYSSTQKRRDANRTRTNAAQFSHDQRYHGGGS